MLNQRIVTQAGVQYEVLAEEQPAWHRGAPKESLARLTLRSLQDKRLYGCYRYSWGLGLVSARGGSEQIDLP